MAARGEIKIHEIAEFGKADWFLLNSTERKYKSRYEHEVAAADIFCAFVPHMESWIVEPFILKERADRGLKMAGKTIYFEVDMCQEAPIIHQAKVQNYIDYSRATGERFHVVFVFCGSDDEIDRRGTSLLRYLSDQRRGEQFTTVAHKNISKYPLAPILWTPKGEQKSILDVA